MIGCRGAACGCSGTDVLSDRAGDCSGTAFLVGCHAALRFKLFLIRARKALEGAMMSGCRFLSLRAEQQIVWKAQSRIHVGGDSATIT
jgi:hypothetical protein